MTKPQHGGCRNPPGGRPRLFARTVKITVSLSADDLKHLDTLSSNRSEAIRLLISQDQARQGRP